MWLCRLFQAPPELEHTGGGSCCALHTPRYNLNPELRPRGPSRSRQGTRGGALEEGTGLWALTSFIVVLISQESPVGGRAPCAASFGRQRDCGLLPESHIQHHIWRPRQCAHWAQLERRKRGSLLRSQAWKLPRIRGRISRGAVHPVCGAGHQECHLPKTALSIQKIRVSMTKKKQSAQPGICTSQFTGCFENERNLKT